MVSDLLYLAWLITAAFVAVALSGCGSEPKQSASPAPIPGSKYSQVQALVQEHCANCHDGVKQKAFDEARWNSSNAKARIENNTMPPNKPLEPEVKAKLLASF